MAHFVRTHVSWIGVTPSAGDFADLDAKTFAAINGDAGGTWAPSALIIIGGQGIRVLGPCLVAAAGLIQTMPASGARFQLGDSDYPVLLPGHAGASRTIVTPVQIGLSGPGSIAIDSASGAMVSLSVGVKILVPIRVHQGATLGNVTLNFRVGTAHGGGVPSQMPQVRVFRVDSAGNITYLKTAGGGVGADGWLSITTPISGAAWYNGGAAQTFAYACDQNNVIDVGVYQYVAEIWEEGGTNGAAGNFFQSFTCALSAIADMHFQ